MTTGIEANEFLMRCSCGDRIEHVAWLIHDPDDSRENNLKGEHDDWYLMVALEPRYSFWQRLSVAIRYLFRFRVKYWGYVELVLRTQDIADLEDFIAERRHRARTWNNVSPHSRKRGGRGEDNSNGDGK